MVLRHFVFVLITLTAIEFANADNFLILGDWGGVPIRPYTTEVEEYTAKQMATEAKEKNSKFVVALGKRFTEHFHVE